MSCDDSMMTQPPVFGFVKNGPWSLVPGLWFEPRRTRSYTNIFKFKNKKQTTENTEDTEIKKEKQPPG